MHAVSLLLLDPDYLALLYSLLSTLSAVDKTPITRRSSTLTETCSPSCPQQLQFGPLRQASVPPSPLPGIETYNCPRDPSRRPLAL